MDCPSCGAPLLRSMRFCPSCGEPVGRRCAQCGAALEAHFRFCPECGSRASTDAGPAGPQARAARRSPGEPAAGERKQVTVLFCDLANSTGIAEPLDPEEYRELLGRYLESVMSEIEAAGGVVNQLTGDGVMALFGAPIAREDSPARAVSAALAIQRRLLAGATGEHPLEARIGIHTGLAVVGTVGSEAKTDYTAIGDTTNLASRLESLADPGTIWISESTQRLLGGRFSLELVGPVRLKGRSERVRAYRVLGQREPDAASGQALTPFIGREAYLGQLEDSFTRVGAGLTQMVAIVGEAGSGKSRLVHEFKRRTASRGATILEARCSSLASSVPDYVWIRMLENHFGIQPDDSAEAREQRVRDGVSEWDPDGTEIAPYLCRMLSIDRGEPPEGSRDELRRASFRAVERLITGLADRGPVVLVLEDLHWIDEDSRHDLEMAAARIEGGRILLVVSHRPDYRPRWETRSAFTQLNLGALADAHIGEIVDAVAGAEVPAELRARLVAKAEGNPFYAEELTRAVLEAGDLVVEDGRMRTARPVDEIPIPSSVHELLGARLDRLPATAKRLAQTAAVAGRQFRTQELEHLLMGSGVDVSQQLSLLEGRGIVYPRRELGEGVYRFGESLTQEVAYESLLLRERRRLHAQLARFVEGDPAGKTPERAALLAHHWSRSDDRPRAVRALLVAALEAEAIPAFTTAFRFRTQAWTLAREWLLAGGVQSEADRRAALEAAIGVSRARALTRGSGPESDDAFERGVALAEELRDPVSLAELLAQRGTELCNLPGSFSEGLGLIERASQIAQAEDSALPALRMGRQLGWAYLLDSRIDEARRLLGEVVDGLAALGERDAQTDLYVTARAYRDRALSLAGELASAESETRETLRCAEQAPNRSVQATSLARLARLALEGDDPERAAVLAEQALAIAREYDLLPTRRTANAIALLADAARGLPADTRHLDGLCEEISRGSDIAFEADLVVEALLAVGRPAEAARAVEVAREWAAGQLRETLTELAEARAAAAEPGADPMAAPPRFERCAERAQAQGLRRISAAAWVDAGVASERAGDSASAARQAALALEVAKGGALSRIGRLATQLLARLDARRQRQDLH
ncbi:MAG: AAA family ATPase [Myxococcota bacterium]